MRAEIILKYCYFTCNCSIGQTYWTVCHLCKNFVCYCAGEVLNQFRSITRQYSYFFRLFQVLIVATEFLESLVVIIVLILKKVLYGTLVLKCRIVSCVFLCRVVQMVLNCQLKISALMTTGISCLRVQCLFDRVM